MCSTDRPSTRTYHDVSERRIEDALTGLSVREQTLGFAATVRPDGTLPVASLGMTIFLVDHEHRQRDGEVTDVGDDQVQIVYTGRRRLFFWRR